METQWAQQQKLGLQAMGDTDEFKRILTETNPYLLGITALVSVLHMVFDTLAFKVQGEGSQTNDHRITTNFLLTDVWFVMCAQNDIQFWRDNKSMVGLSAKKLSTDCIVRWVRPHSHGFYD
jgi:hypothetical protein